MKPSRSSDTETSPDERLDMSEPRNPSVKESFVIENRGLTTDQAEDRVERQAREFELLKPYLIDRWTVEGVSADRDVPAPAAAAGRPTA